MVDVAALARDDRRLLRLSGETLFLYVFHVALVAHGHVLRILTARWLGLAPEAGRWS